MTQVPLQWVWRENHVIAMNEDPRKVARQSHRVAMRDVAQGPHRDGVTSITRSTGVAWRLEMSSNSG